MWVAEAPEGFRSCRLRCRLAPLWGGALRVPALPPWTCAWDLGDVAALVEVEAEDRENFQSKLKQLQLQQQAKDEENWATLQDFRVVLCDVVQGKR